MGGLAGLHEVSYWGECSNVAFGAATNTEEQLLADPEADGPRRYLLETDQICYVRSGNSSVEADSSDGRLIPGVYAVLTVTSVRNAWISVMGAGTSGTLRITEISGAPNDNPSDGLSFP